MGLFNRKLKVVKNIHDAAWGCLVQHGIDVDTLAREVRRVEREGTLNGTQPVTFVRVFKTSGGGAEGGSGHWLGDFRRASRTSAL